MLNEDVGVLNLWNCFRLPKSIYDILNAIHSKITFMRTFIGFNLIRAHFLKSKSNKINKLFAADSYLKIHYTQTQNKNHNSNICVGNHTHDLQTELLPTQLWGESKGLNKIIRITFKCLRYLVEPGPRVQARKNMGFKLLVYHVVFSQRRVWKLLSSYKAPITRAR